MYPFAFVYWLTYELVGNKLNVTFAVENNDKKVMYFGVGGHPGFAVPLEKGLEFEDYCLQFEAPGNPIRVGFSEDCFVNGEDSEFILSDGGKLPLAHNLFDQDAIVLTDMAKAVTLCSEKGTRSVRVSYPQIVISYQLLSHIPGTFFIFTEAPQLHGIADHIDTIHAGEQQRENNRAHPLDSCPEGCLAAHLDAPRFLRMLDLGKVRLNIRDVAQCDGGCSDDYICGWQPFLESIPVKKRGAVGHGYRVFRKNTGRGQIGRSAPGK